MERRGPYGGGPGSMFRREEEESLLLARVRELRWERSTSRRRKGASAILGEGDGQQMASRGTQRIRALIF